VRGQVYIIYYSAEPAEKLTLESPEPIE
jgi:hypothetical protein